MEFDLEIFIVTYNRSILLKQTLEYLYLSKLRNYKITILNNCSIDDTLTVAEAYKSKLQNLSTITHKMNIGVCANIMRAFELGSCKYTWVLCDDDFIDLTHFDDVLNKIKLGELDLIHVGAHPNKEWMFGGKTYSAKQLVKAGYPYFKYSSFIPCNIFRTDKFQKEYMIKGYNNVTNGYPHMPFLFDIFENDGLVYMSEKQIVTASQEGQSYNTFQWLLWWMDTCKQLTNKQDVQLAFFDQLENLDRPTAHSYLIDRYWNNINTKEPLRVFINNYFDEQEKKQFYLTLKKKTNVERITNLKKLFSFGKIIYNKLKH